jgi:hypothetical protein
LRHRLKQIGDEIEKAETNYKTHGKNSTLFLIAETDGVAGKVTTAEMRKLYSGTFSRLNSPTRTIYEKIKAAPKGSICPLCGHRIVTTLDHYLALSRHPGLAVTPLNLVPACSDCNKIKLAKQPAKASDQTFHPYFDEVDADVWLSASVERSDPLVITFKPAPPSHWSDLKKQRLYKHFAVFELGKLYSVQAAVELGDIRDRLHRDAAREGAQGIRRSLQEDALSRRAADKNSWRSAFYIALAESDWFCSEGYKKIPEPSP